MEVRGKGGGSLDKTGGGPEPSDGPRGRHQVNRKPEGEVDRYWSEEARPNRPGAVVVPVDLGGDSLVDPEGEWAACLRLVEHVDQ